jgi:hypothetical protein
VQVPSLEGNSPVFEEMDVPAGDIAAATHIMTGQQLLSHIYIYYNIPYLFMIPPCSANVLGYQTDH